MKAIFAIIITFFACMSPAMADNSIRKGLPYSESVINNNKSECKLYSTPQNEIVLLAINPRYGSFVITLENNSSVKVESHRKLDGEPSIKSIDQFDFLFLQPARSTIVHAVMKDKGVVGFKFMGDNTLIFNYKKLTVSGLTDLCITLSIFDE